MRAVLVGKLREMERGAKMREVQSSGRVVQGEAEPQFTRGKESGLRPGRQGLLGREDCAAPGYVAVSG